MIREPMTRINLVELALAVLFLLFAAPVLATESSSRMSSGLYARRATLEQTLLTTRANYQQWSASQRMARQCVALGPWFSRGGLTEMASDGTTVFDFSAMDPQGKPVWTRQDAMKDGAVLKPGFGAPCTLGRTLTAKQPVMLTVGIGGGDRLTLALNGKRIASIETALAYERYGCSNLFVGKHQDQVLVDLQLEAGENQLLVQIEHAAGSGPLQFYFSAAPHPVHRLWDWVREDFPPHEHALLEAIGSDWLEPAGWFTAEDAALELPLLSDLLDRIGPASDELRRRLQDLQSTRTPSDDPRWLDLCVAAAELEHAVDQIHRTRQAVTHLNTTYPDRYHGEATLDQLDELKRRFVDWAEQYPQGKEGSVELTVLRQQFAGLRFATLVSANPLLAEKQLLFVKRHTYNSKHYYDDFQHIRLWGGNLCVLSLADGSVRELLPEMSDGVFDRYDLSFDATRIVFGYRRPLREGFRIYEVGVDGDGLREVTQPPANEAERMAAYGKTSTGDGFYGSLGYQFWTDDVHPCYLPDGGFCFASTRCEHGVLCTPAHYLACTNLFRMNADGSGMRPISQGALSEFTPTLMEDGRILYNRWEYVYKGIAAVQPLWITRPDGSGSEEFYGDNVANPGVLWQARQVPGHPRLAVCIGCGHEPLGVGQVLLLDLNKNKRSTEPMVSLTPNVKTENLRGLYQLRNGVWREDVFGPFYADPYPLSDKFFLVSCNPRGRYNDPAGYGIYLLDAFGNRVLVHHDPEMSCWQPMPLQPRPAPPILPEVDKAAFELVLDEPTEVAAPTVPSLDETATVFVSDVYRGLDGVAPGTIKYLRVMEQIPKPWAAEVDPVRGEDRSADGFGGHLVVSHNAHIWIAVLHGIVPVEPDGSACFEVPAGRNLFFQALDAEFMEVQRMRTFVNFEAGEQRSCIGCHEHRTQAPLSRMTMAFGREPARLLAQPGEVAPRPLYYPTDVQPVLDRHCVSCHDGQAGSDAPDLRGELTTLFNLSYENLMQGGYIATVREWAGSNYAMENAAAVPPYTHGAHASRLTQILRDEGRGHDGLELSQADWIKLVTWMDSGAPYYGSYYGRRHLGYRGQPDFRPTPTLASACGIPPEFPELAKPEPVPAKLLAHWPLDDADPVSVTDASAATREIKAVGTAKSPGHDGSGGRSFDGRAFLEAESLGSHPAVSIALWVKPASLNGTWNPLLFCHEGQAGAIHFSLLADGTPNVAINTGEWNWTHRKARTSLAVGQWHHVVLICDGRLGGRTQFYVDGKLVNEEPLGLALNLDLYRFRIGGWNRWERSPGNNFHGEIDDVRIYQGILTAEEVSTLAKD